MTPDTSGNPSAASQRPPGPRENAAAAARRNALLAALAVFAVLAVSAAFTPGGLPKFYICAFHRLTGVPCPGCGLTRAFCAISHGDFAAAWRFNPFAFLFYAFTLAVPFWAAWNWRNPGRGLRLLRNGKFMLAATGLLAASMLAYNVWRICQGWR